jgi:hypothetical protein
MKSGERALRRRTLTALSAARAVLPYGLGVSAAGLAVAGVWVDQPAFGAGGTALGLCTAVLERRRCGSVLTHAAALRERLRRQRVESGDAAARLRQEVRTLQVQLWEHQLRAIPVADLPALPQYLPTADPQLAVPPQADPGDPVGDLVAELTSAWFDPGPEVAEAELADADAGPVEPDPDPDPLDHAAPVHAESAALSEPVHAAPVHAESAPMPETAPIPVPQVSEVIEAIRARVIDLGAADVAGKAESVADIELPADPENTADAENTDPENIADAELESAVPASAR